jgi:hypothetical protein
VYLNRPVALMIICSGVDFIEQPSNLSEEPVRWEVRQPVRLRLLF